MTLVVGVDFGDEMLVLADSRLSYADGSPPPMDCLKKLLVIGFTGRTEAVLGYSGNVLAIQSIVDNIRIRAKAGFSKSGILKDDLKVLMEDAIRMKRKRDKIQFMLCDFNPGDGVRLCVYTLHKDGRVELSPKDRVAIIGSGAKLTDKILDSVRHSFRNHPEGYCTYESFSGVRKGMIEGPIAGYFRDIDSQEVGGPFMMLILRSDGVSAPVFTWPWGSDSLGVEITSIKTYKGTYKTILYKPSTGERYTLFPLDSYGGADFSQNSSVVANNGHS